MTKSRLAVVWVAAGLVAAGGGLLGYVVHAVGEARAYQANALIRLDRLAGAHAPAPPRPLDGDPLGEIRIARIGLQAVVAEGESDAVLRRAVGHVSQSPALGAQGNVVLAGHRDSFFRPLRHVRVGDDVTVTAGGRVAVYTVEWTAVVPPTDLDVLRPTTTGTLTLVTCYPFSYVGAAPNRFIVRARLRAPPGAAAVDVSRQVYR